MVFSSHIFVFYFLPFALIAYYAAPRASERQRKVFLVVSLLSNAGMLCFFKYFMFAEENVNALLAALGQREFNILVVLLPLPERQP